MGEDRSTEEARNRHEDLDGDTTDSDELPTDVSITDFAEE
jgi:hypothetical protein